MRSVEECIGSSPDAKAPERVRREFPAKVKVAAFQRANGQCEICGARLTVGKFRYDHQLPDALGGEPTLENCVVRCLPCDKPKTAADITRIRKADRQRNNHLGIRKRSRFPGSKDSPFKIKLDGSVVRR